MVLVKHRNGSFFPAYNKDREQADKIAVGEEVYATKQRNIKFHRKAFSLLNLAFENQSKYKNVDIYRAIITMKAGFVEWQEDLNGVNHPFAKSWSFEKMNAEDFERMYSAILEVVSKELKLAGSDIEKELENYL